MTRTLILASLLLTLAVPVGAEDWLAGPGRFCGEDAFCYDSTWEAYKQYLNGDDKALTKDKCLAKMKAAMWALRQWDSVRKECLTESVSTHKCPLAVLDKRRE
jgi:hypothetical protein